MLFQMCYGPELESIYEVVRRSPDCTLDDLQMKFQYAEEGDIRSLIEGAVTVLTDLGLVYDREGKFCSQGDAWDVIDVLLRLRRVGNESEEATFDHVFSHMYYELFVKSNTMFIKNLHHQTNQRFPDTLVGKEKVNAWKRMMEFFGVGHRVYSGFYALPQLRLMERFIERSGEWSGPLHQYCQEQIHPVLPCVHNGDVFRGVIYGLSFLDKQGVIRLTRKQDLPYSSYGPQHQWNWIEVGEG
ncbi:hypothetical protein EV586_105231 [Tumebacillus sp. BK434]|uniref:hypothetical protein n=1 Tax=Tumebacillus sp. BK434 TaxID=2512169 RepID=UPI0010514778|nr:hypothetical protein [Tumebacillus sp. BK434]TCP53885.1 hypothetical protein EV586_105231 [Tumebacillus sp. BK434]